AANVNVSSDITVDTTWTANNVYNLTKQIYVTNGASLTIEAGTVVASTPSDNGSGSLAVSRGSKIYVQGTAEAPVIMTSTNDVATWAADPSHPTGKDPKSGTWREAANEWGNLTIMGNALIGYSYEGNTATPDGTSEAQMEGLVADGPGDQKVLYGGNDDNDDSGSISYLSLRYGGRVVGKTNELNGLSLGAIGRETEINHVEIMNNVDDGIEIWGGTVEIKYFSIWNIGDDSFDVDQGWRGKAQFGLIVQGYSVNASQGSGVGDNAFETDGAENSDAQPVTTAVIYNATVIGQPAPGAGDGGTAWRDNARIQYRNCIFMDLGEKLVHFDDIDGDGADGYAHNGTLSWAATWTTDAGVHSTVNTGGVNLDNLYKSQVDGKLAEISDSVFWRNLDAAAYTEATARGVFDAANNNVLASYDPGNPTGNQPIQEIQRGALVVRGGKDMLPVTTLNPCAANDAVTSVKTAPADGFFTPASYRGAFSPTYNWLIGWSASDAFGFLAAPAEQTTATPEATGELTKVVTEVSFDTEAGVVYTVEKSSDMKTWSPIDTIVGNGSSMSIEHLDTFEDGKFYRVIKQ
ncbi:MAG: hypothetical protein ACLFUJ_16480, partial [Phycisphaerae bacterium]